MFMIDNFTDVYLVNKKTNQIIHLKDIINVTTEIQFDMFDTIHKTTIHAHSAEMLNVLEPKFIMDIDEADLTEMLMKQ